MSFEGLARRKEGDLQDCGVPDHPKKVTAADLVNHPPHYTKDPSGTECIEVTEHRNFCIGNAIKYLWRCDDKDSPVQDLEKAKWYIQREIDRRLKHGV